MSSTVPPGRHALFPGTFDPVTRGHLDVLERALSLFERVTLAVAKHPGKNELFDRDERVALLGEATAGLEHAGRVAVTVFDGLLVDGARAVGAGAIVRGVRSATDLEYERQMALTNRDLAPELETVLLLAAHEHGHVSSTLVRQIARLGGDVSRFVPPVVQAALARRFEKDSR